MAQVFHDVACTQCGCVCDDLVVRIDSGRITAAEDGCPQAKEWFKKQVADCDSPVKIDGAPATFKAGVGRAAEILAQSRAPLVFGLSTSSTPGQRAAVELAEALGATIAAAASSLEVATIAALQTVGMSTATLGEVRNRADLVIYWGSDPAASHPRHVERFVDARGTFVPQGRQGRRLVVVDVVRTATAQLADHFIEVQSGGDFELLRTLRAVVNGSSFAEASAEVAELAEQMKMCRYGTVFFGLGLSTAAVAELAKLVIELNAHTRFVAQPMSSVGAKQVLTWLTGYPGAMNFALGYPRYGPDEFTAELLLARGEVDAVVLVGMADASQLSVSAQASLAMLPVIALHGPLEAFPVPAAVSFATAVYGIHRPGTAYRMDGVPIPLRKILDSSLPSDAEVLAAIQQECAHALAKI